MPRQTRESVFARPLIEDLRLARPDATRAEITAALETVGALGWAACCWSTARSSSRDRTRRWSLPGGRYAELWSAWESRTATATA